MTIKQEAPDSMLSSHWSCSISPCWMVFILMICLLTMSSVCYTRLPLFLQCACVLIILFAGSYLFLRDGLLGLPESIVGLSYQRWHQQWFLHRRSGEVMPVTLHASSRLYSYCTVFRARDDVGRQYSLVIPHDGMARCCLSRLRVAMLSCETV